MHTDPDYIIQEQSVNTDYQRLASEQPGVHKNEAS
jgi:hypothetical protein